MTTTGTPPTALRPPVSGSGAARRGRHHRHESRRPPLDGSGVAPHDTEGSGQPGRDEPRDIGARTRNPGTPAPRQEAHRTAAPGCRIAPKLAVHVGERTAA